MAKKKKKVTRVRLTNAEKAAGMTLEQKKAGVKLEDLKTEKEVKDVFDENNSKKVGSKVEKVLKKTGVSKVVKAVLGDDCGCEERKEILNNMFLRYKGIKCLLPAELQYLNLIGMQEKNSFKPSEVREISLIWSRISGVPVSKIGGCPDCLREMVKNMVEIHKLYKDV